MSSYQDDNQGRGGWGRRGGGARGGRQYDNQGRGGANPNWRGNPSNHTGAGGQSAGYVGQGGRGQYTGHMRGPQSDYIGSTPGGPSPQQVYAPPGSGAQYQHQDLNPRHPQHSGWAQRGPSPQQVYAPPGSGAPSQHQDLNPKLPQQSGWPQRGPSPQPGSRAPNQYQDLNPRPPQQSGLVQRGLPPQTIRALPTQYPAPTQRQEAHRPYVGTTPDLHQANQPRLVAPIPQATLVSSDGMEALEQGYAGLEGEMRQLTLPPSSTKVIKFPRRPGQGKRGERVVVRANHFLVQLQAKTLHHYDVTITPTVASRGTNRAIMRALLKVYQHSNLNGRLPVYDGRKSIYTAGPLPFESKRFDVTLSDEDRPS